MAAKEKRAKSALRLFCCMHFLDPRETAFGRRGGILVNFDGEGGCCVRCRSCCHFSLLFGLLCCFGIYMLDPGVSRLVTLRRGKGEPTRSIMDWRGSTKELFELIGVLLRMWMRARGFADSSFTTPSLSMPRAQRITWSLQDIPFWVFLPDTRPSGRRGNPHATEPDSQRRSFRLANSSRYHATRAEQQRAAIQTNSKQSRIVVEMVQLPQTSLPPPPPRNRLEKLAVVHSKIAAPRVRFPVDEGVTETGCSQGPLSPDWE